MVGSPVTAGLVLPTDLQAVGAMHRQYQRTNCIRLRGFVAGARMGLIRRQLRRETFYRRDHAGIGAELCLPQAGPTTLLMHTLLNDPELFQAVQQLTGCPPVGCLTGRIYRLCAGEGLGDDWHGDNVDSRMVGLTVNLGDAPFEGGLLQIRTEADGRLTAEVHNVGFGDAVLFRIDPSLKHRNTPLAAGSAKTAFAGWFRAQPHYSSLLPAWIKGTFAQRQPVSSE